MLFRTFRARFRFLVTLQTIVDVAFTTGHGDSFVVFLTHYCLAVLARIFSILYNIHSHVHLFKVAFMTLCVDKRQPE